jgi:MYXO-CTERM domain-containing protein
MCLHGECVGDPNAMTGNGGTASGSGGTDVVVITGGTLNGSGAATSGGSSNGGNKLNQVTTDQKSCNCSVPGAPSSRLAALGLLALFGVARRRRRAA